TFGESSLACAAPPGGGASEGAATAAHGEVHVASRVVGFKKIKFYTNENVGSGELDLPEQEMHTTAWWLTLPAAVVGRLPFGADDRRDAILGLACALRHVAQLLLMCDRHDIGLSIEMDGSGPAASTGSRPIPALASPRIFIYDNYPGGIGFSEPLSRMPRELLDGAHRLIAECDCEAGCPACVGPVGEIGPKGKAAALELLRLIAGDDQLAGGAHAGEAAATDVEAC